MIRGLWDSQFYAIVDVKLVDADTDTYKYEPTPALPDRWENIKKDNHGNHCHNQLKHFPPFVISVDGMIGKEALVVFSQLIQVIS